MQNWEETCSCQSNLSPPESVVQMSLVRPKPQTYMGLELSHSCPDLVLKGSGLKLPSSFRSCKGLGIWLAVGAPPQAVLLQVAKR